MNWKCWEKARGPLLVAVVMAQCASFAVGQLTPPFIGALQPPTAPVNFAGLSLTIVGSNFTPLSQVRFAGQPLNTIFVSTTQLVADLDPPLSTQAGTYPVTVQDGSRTSNPATFTLLNRVPQIFSLMPTGVVLAGQGTTQFTVDGADFAQTAIARWDGTVIPSVWLGRFSLQITVPGSLLAFVASSNLTVQNPGPGGGISNAFNVPVRGPTLSGSFPSAPLAPTSSTTLFFTGTNFSSGAQLVIDGEAIPTTFVDSATLRTSLPSSWPGLQRPGALVVNVVNPGSVVSNTLAVPNIAAVNRGTLRRFPLVPPRGTGYYALFEDGAAFAPLTVVVDGAATPVQFPWPNAVTPFALGVRALPSGPLPWLTLGDGLGLYGPADGTAFSGVGAHLIGPLTLPSPSLGLDFQVQAVFTDPSAPTGVRLTWMKVESL